jgi:hypothetical protein
MKRTHRVEKCINSDQNHEKLMKTSKSMEIKLSAPRTSAERSLLSLSPSLAVVVDLYRSGHRSFCGIFNQARQLKLLIEDT